MLAFMGMVRVMWRATQAMVALWWPLRTLRCAPLRLPDVEGNTVRLSGGCSGPSKVAWDRVIPHAKSGGGFPPSAAHSNVNSDPSFTGTNWLPGSSRRPSISRYVPRGASATNRPISELSNDEKSCPDVFRLLSRNSLFYIYIRSTGKFCPNLWHHFRPRKHMFIYCMFGSIFLSLNIYILT